MLVQQHDLVRQIESITVNLQPYIRKIVTQIATTNPQNGQTLIDHINAELVERNIADDAREWKIKTLTWLSAHSRHGKTFRDMTKQDILLYLNTLRKTVDGDPPQRWIGTYNNGVLVFTKFFRWLYKPNEYKKRKTPACMSGIKQLPKTQTRNGWGLTITEHRRLASFSCGPSALTRLRYNRWRSEYNHLFARPQKDLVASFALSQ